MHRNKRRFLDCWNTLLSSRVWVRSSRCSCEMERRRHICYRQNEGRLQGTVRNLPRISIFVPSSRDLWILLINCQGEILEMFLQLICHQKARGASPDANYVDMSFRVDWTTKPMFCMLVRCCVSGNYEVCHGVQNEEDEDRRRRFNRRKQENKI